MFNDFYLAKYEIVIEAGLQGLLLPPYKGSTLRGGFGHVFRRISCSQPETECSQCLLNQSCPYAQIFEPSPPPDSKVLKKYSDIPRPFVMEPPLETKTNYDPGDQLVFSLVLIGQATSYLPYFILAFKELGRVGLGTGRRPYELVEVRGITAKGEKTVVYRQGTKHITPVAPIAMKEFYGDQCGDKIVLCFETMTRLQHGQTLVTDIPFHVLLRALLRRISTLYYFYHGQEPGSEGVDYRGLIEAAEKVQTAASSLQLVDWERFSQRQNTHMNMGGLVGEVTYEGDLAQLMPLLLLGEMIHVGKGCVFGLGKFVVRVGSPH